MNNVDFIDLCNNVKKRQLTFTLNPNEYWDEKSDMLKNALNSTFYEVKFLDESENKLHADMDTLPNNKGGIYIFVLKTNLLPDTHQYIMYIGRAQITTSQNLKKRCREYLKYKNTADRLKINRMINYWGKYLYIKYISLDDNNIIIELEKELLNSIVPPCNSDIPDKIIQKVQPAF